MKRILKAVALSLMLVSGSVLQNTASAQYYDDDDDRYDHDREVSYQTFYDELSPYGRWVDYPNYGYVWVPDAGPDFRPYSSRGHWVWTDNYEWMWVSDYDWGWAPFHYGRWDYDSYIGWYWVPGYEWSPAWVAWRDGGDYYGWAPIRPGISISINFNIGRYSPPFDFWCFAPRRYITSPRIYDYYVDRRQNVTIINQTTVIINNYHYGNNYGFRSGPRRYDAERYCGRIEPVRFRESYRPGRTQFRNNEITVYRPEVRREDNRRFAPRSFERYDRNNNTGFRRNDNNRIERPANNDQNSGSANTRRFDRNNDQTRQQNNGNNDNGFERRRFDRSDDANRQQENQRRFDQQRQQEENQKRFERQRQEQQQQQENQRRFDQQRQQEENQKRLERQRQEQQQQQENQRRFDQQRQQENQRRFERPQQQQQPQQQQEQPSRRFERRNEDNQQQKNDNGNGKGKGNSRSRF